jgi:hypothetical protein
MVGAVVLRIKSKGEKMTEYTYTTHNTAAFHIPEGMYTIAELEQMVADFKEAKAMQDRHLQKALGIGG